MKIRSLALFCVMGLAFAACGRDSTGSGGAGGTAGAGGTGGTGGTGGSGGGMGTTIKNLRMNPPGIGTTVTLSNVVVVQRVDSTKHGDVYVQDMGGGMYSGIHLYCNYGGTNPNCPMQRSQIQTVLRGQVVNVTGNYKPFMYNTPPGAPTELEIDAPMITSTGMTGTPTAINVTASQVAKGVASMTTPPPAALDGTYVKVTDGPFMISDVMAMEFEGTCPVGDGGNTWFGVDATGSGQTLALSLTFHTSSTNSTSLSWCSGTCFGCMPAMELSGHTFSTVSGIAAGSSNAGNNSIFLQIMPTIDTDLPM